MAIGKRMPVRATIHSEMPSMPSFQAMSGFLIHWTSSTSWKPGSRRLNRTTTPMARAPVSSENSTAACLVSSGRRFEVIATTRAPKTGVRTRTDRSGKVVPVLWAPSDASSSELIRSPPSRG